jgi:predicted metalloendopeptidase
MKTTRFTSRWVLVVALGALSLGCSEDDDDVTSDTLGEQPAPAPAEIGPWGFDLPGMDASVAPGDSFYAYAIGGWQASHEIPADRAAWGSFDELILETGGQVQGLVEGLPAAPPAGSAAQKVRDYYGAYLDTTAIDAAGLAPAQAGLDAIGAATSHTDVAALMGRADLALPGPIGVGVTLDEKNPDRYVVGVGQSGLSLDERDYYLDPAPEYAELREAYRAHVERVLGLLSEPDAAAKSASILALETEIAELSWPAEMRRDRELTYNLLARADLSVDSGDFPWDAMLVAAGLGDQQEFIVGELGAVKALGAWFSSIPVETWIAYMKYQYVMGRASVLPAPFYAELFDFYGRTLNGQPEPRPRDQRAITALNGALGEAAGELYVQQYFPESAKEQMVELVENLRDTFSVRLDALTWMSDATKQAAHRKLETFLPKIGYPDEWTDYSSLEVVAGDAFGNAVRATEWAWAQDLDRLGKPSDRSEWGMTPQTVNAYYNSTFNEIVFPAAILQPPFFDPNADPAVNYGAIGAVIGHEMGHGFDDQGSKSDERGVLRTWWQPEDEAAFRVLVDKLIAQYDAYEALPGLNVNGALTVGENIGDLGGVSIAYAAYRRSLDGAEAPVLDGLTGDQRFFLAWAQVWREVVRDEALRNQVLSDPHSPALFRVNGVVRNIDAWYDAFDVQPGDALYLPPEERVQIW